MKSRVALLSVFVMALLPATGRAAWTAPVPLPGQGSPACALGISACQPAGAINGAGDAVVLVRVLEHPGTHDHTADLLAITHEPGGSWDPPVSVPYGDNVAAAQATIDSDGGVVADWSRIDGRAFYSVRAAGGSFGAAVQLPATNGKLASDAAGDQLLVWADAAGPAYASFRPAGGSFGAPINLAPGQSADPSEVAMDPAGDAVVLLDTGTSEEAVYRPAGGSFGAPQTLDTEPADALNIEGEALAINAGGTAVAVWEVLNSDGVPTLFAATRPPGGSFGAPMTLQPHDPVTASDFQSVKLAIDQRGDAVASWWAVDYQGNGSDLFALRAAYQPAGGAFGSAAQLTPESPDFAAQSIALDPSGTAVALWQRDLKVGVGRWVTEAAVRSAHGSFGAPVTLSSDGLESDQYAPAQVAINEQGNAFLLWSYVRPGGGFHEEIQATQRSPGGAFASPQTIGEAFGPESLSVDDAGDALVVTSSWVAGYDPQVVQLRNVTLPPPTLAGRPASFSASASGVWGPQLSWRFGDNQTGTGSTVTHAYAKGGTYKVTVTAGAGSADQASETGRIRIGNAIWKLRISPRTLALAHVCKNGAQHGHCETKVSYRLALAGKVRLWVERQVPGRRAGKRCVRARRGARGDQRCTMYVRLHGTLVHAGRRGRNAFRFDDHIAGRRLKPGRYRLFAQAPTGQVASAPFRIS